MSTEYRYFLKYDNCLEHEVTKQIFINAERSCGFFPQSDRPDQLATGGFAGKGVFGRIERTRPS